MTSTTPLVRSPRELRASVTQEIALMPEAGKYPVDLNPINRLNLSNSSALICRISKSTFALPVLRACFGEHSRCAVACGNRLFGRLDHSIVMEPGDPRLYPRSVTLVSASILIIRKRKQAGVDRGVRSRTLRVFKRLAGITGARDSDYPQQMPKQWSASSQF